MAATASIITPSPLLSLLLLLLLVNQFQLSIASHPDPCSSTRFRNTCSNVFQLNLSAINVTDDRVSFSISSSSLTLLNITYTVNSSSGGCSTGSGECRNDSYQYYSNGASSSQEQELTNVYHIFCNVKQNELVSMKLDFGNCSYTFGLPQDRRAGNFCPDDYDNGLLWQQSRPSIVFKTCHDISEQFSTNSYAYRTCRLNGTWNSTDISNCRLKPSFAENGFFNIWYEFNAKEPYNKDYYLISNMTSQLTSVNYSNISLQYVTRNGLLIRAGFTVTLATNLSLLREWDSISSLVRELKELKTLSIYEIKINTTQAQTFQPITSCRCDMNYRNFPLSVCVGNFGPPCDCSNGNCKCSPGYVGDGVECTVDSDFDGFPDVPLDSCTIGPKNISKYMYCRKDKCPNAYNPSQSNFSCIGCEVERDRIWNLTWPDTPFGKTALQNCPNSTTEKASRECHSSGGWSWWPRTSNCSQSDWFYFKLYNDTNYAVNHNLTNEERITELNYLYGELSDSYSFPPSDPNGGPSIGQPHNLKKSPYSLLHINKMVDYTLKLLPSGEFDDYNSYTFIPSMLDVFDDLLNEDYAEEWKEVEETQGHHFGSTLLLENVENYFLYYTGFEKSVSIRRNNFNIMSDVYNLTSRVAEGDYIINSNLSESYVTLRIPEGILREKTANGIQPVSIVSIQFRSLDDFLSTDINNTNDTRILSNVWSGQIGSEGTVFSEPILISFTAERINNETHKYVCSYWNTTSGQWMTDGVYTVATYEWTDNRSYVICSAYHLTAFAVLVSVNGNNEEGSNEEEGTIDGSGDDDDDQGSALRLNQRTMSIVTYIGCAASVLCLILSFIFFIAQYKDLLEKPHLFIHLNLIIALLIAYSIFGLGIELANGNEVLCTVVAGLLHYFFLASFCWMLCEGIMLYLLLVVVFSRLAKRWYLFLAIGWITPLIPVSISMSVRYDEYNIKDPYGNISYCWLSSKSGTIWAFLAPMILIIAINIVFFVLIVRSLCKSKRMEKSKKIKATSLRQQALSLFKSCIILLPLMGFTWLFGLLTFDTNTYTLIFAWLFTILNSTQGVAIFILYVVRNEKVWSKLTFCFRKYISKEVSSTSKTMMKPSLKSTRTLLSNVSLSQTNNTFGDNSSQDGNSSTSEPPADNTSCTLSVTDLTATHKIEDTKDDVSTASVKINFN